MLIWKELCTACVDWC